MTGEREHANVGRFAGALRGHAAEFRVELSDADADALARYYELTMRWNARLHLVAPCTPEEFAVRHVLESLVAARFMPGGARVVDVGAGAGLPSIPCLVVRADLRATLVESSTKKAVFLREALRHVGRHAHANVVAERFERVEAPPAEVVTCRALERLTEMLPRLVSWSPPASTLLVFGGPSVRRKLEADGLEFQTVHVPQSEQRFLFVVRRRTAGDGR